MRERRVLGALVVIALLFPTDLALASSETPANGGLAGCGGCRTPAFAWISIGSQTSPSIYQSGSYATLAISFHSLLDTTSTGKVFASVRNVTGYWAGDFSGNLTLPPGANGTVRMPIHGLQLDSQYTVSYYSANSSGRPLSGTYVDNVYASESSPLLGREPLSMQGSYLCNFGCPLGTPAVLVRYLNTLSSSLPLVTMHGVTRQGKLVVGNMTITTIFSPGQNSTFPFYAGGLAPGVYSLSTFGTMANGSALSGASDTNFQIMPNGLFFIGGTTALTLVNVPRFPTIGAGPAVETIWVNNLSFPVVGIVFATIRNTLGQTVTFSSATVIPPVGGNATAYNILFGLPPGTYSASIFVTSVSFVAIAAPSSLTFTIS